VICQAGRSRSTCHALLSIATFLARGFRWCLPG
jgi:hypothetical protein